MGGMLALEWCLLFGKNYVQSIIMISSTARQSPWAIAWAETQRASVESDPNYRDGCYGDNPPRAGLAAARMAAMISYRSHSSFEKRFERRRLDDQALLKLGGKSKQIRAAEARRDGHHRDDSGIFLAQGYIRYQGDKFNRCFDANCYIHILDKIDTHDVSRGRYPQLSDAEAMRKVLGQIQQQALVIGISSDGLYPIELQTYIAENIPNATFASVRSDDGHDGFLLEGGQVNDLFHWFFNEYPLGEKSSYPQEKTGMSMMTVNLVN